jgi:Adenylylsulphate kinase
VRRIGEVARLMVDAGLIVIASFISPDRVQRDAVRARFEPGEFHEVHVSTPLHECERRDPKGLYPLARAGQVQQFTGISAPYDDPRAPEVSLDTTNRSPVECVQVLVDYVLARRLATHPQAASIKASKPSARPSSVGTATVSPASPKGPPGSTMTPLASKSSSPSAPSVSS